MYRLLPGDGKLGTGGVDLGVQRPLCAPAPTSPPLSGGHLGRVGCGGRHRKMEGLRPSSRKVDWLGAAERSTCPPFWRL